VNAEPVAAYVDSSALVKLVIPEPESTALRAELARWERHVSSALVRVEVVRACARVDAGAREIAEKAVGALDLIALDDDLLEQASRIDPPSLRTLDAIHVASALLVADALAVVVVYDERLAQAMAAAGLPTAAPR
jgi:predicted nucleic acid-binding protein